MQTQFNSLTSRLQEVSDKLVEKNEEAAVKINAMMGDEREVFNVDLPEDATPDEIRTIEDQQKKNVKKLWIVEHTKSEFAMDG